MEGGTAEIPEPPTPSQPLPKDANSGVHSSLYNGPCKWRGRFVQLVACLHYISESYGTRECIPSIDPMAQRAHNVGVVVGCLLSFPDRLVGLVVKVSAWRAEDPWFESRLRRDFFGVESYQ